MANDQVDPHRPKLAKAALDFVGTNTSNFPGAGVDSCASSVNTILKEVFGHEFVRPGGNSNNVTDLREGLQQNGWIAFDGAGGALAGDIAVQNGTHTGTPDNAFENHIGIVVNHNGALQVISNSSSHKSFTYFDGLDFPNIGYPPAKMGPSRFYRFKPKT